MLTKKLIFVFFIIASLNISAQHKPFQFGFKAGGNIGWYNTSADDYKNVGSDFGGSWGFVADFFIMENYSFTTGFDVVYLNGTMSYPTINVYDTISAIKQGTLERGYRTKYVKLPLVFTMKTNEIKKIRYYGQIGLGLSILLTAKANDVFTSTDNTPAVNESHNIYDELRFSRESLILGAGLEIPMQGSTYIRVGITYDNAFVNILKGHNTIDSSVKNNGRNSFLELNVSVLF